MRHTILFSLLAVTIIFAQTAFAGESPYDKEMRREFKMPPEWFACQASSDCALVSIPCMASMSVSAKYKDTAQSVIDKQQGTSPNCSSVMQSSSSALCDNNECVTTIVPKVVSLPCSHGFKSWVNPPKSPNDEMACDQENLNVFKTYLGQCGVVDPEAMKYDYNNDHCITCDDYFQWKDNIKKLYQGHKRSTDGQTLTLEQCDKK